MGDLPKNHEHQLMGKAVLLLRFLAGIGPAVKRPLKCPSLHMA